MHKCIELLSCHEFISLSKSKNTDGGQNHEMARGYLACSHCSSETPRRRWSTYMEMQISPPATASASTHAQRRPSVARPPIVWWRFQWLGPHLHFQLSRSLFERCQEAKSNINCSTQQTLWCTLHSKAAVKTCTMHHAAMLCLWHHTSQHITGTDHARQSRRTNS